MSTVPLHTYSSLGADIAARAEELALKATHKFSTVQLNLPATVAQQIRTLGRQIADADLAEDGRETSPHITVKFGIDTADPADLLRLLSNQPPVRLRLGKLAVFDAAETGAAFDVLTLEVNSPDLERLNRVIVDALPTTQTHALYAPHATVCYLQPGKGEEYTALDNPLEGTALVVGRLTFSNQDGEQTTIPLEGVGTMSSNVNKGSDELYKSLHEGIIARLAELKGGPGSGPHKKEGGTESSEGRSFSNAPLYEKHTDVPLSGGAKKLLTRLRVDHGADVAEKAKLDAQMRAHKTRYEEVEPVHVRNAIHDLRLSGHIS